MRVMQMKRRSMHSRRRSNPVGCRSCQSLIRMGSRTGSGARMSEKFLLHQAPDGSSRVQVRLEGRTLWLTQQQLADLFESAPQNITRHIRAIYTESELIEAATCKPCLQVRDAHGPVLAVPSRAGNCCDAVATTDAVASACAAADQGRPWRKTSTPGCAGGTCDRVI